MFDNFDKIYFLFKIVCISFIHTGYYYIGSIFSFCDYSNYLINIANALSKENILYVKMFQMISMEKKWIPEDVSTSLMKFTDNAPYSNSDIDWKSIVQLKNDYKIVINKNDVPMNSGMISLVFKATDCDKNNIVVKIKRVDVEKKLKDGVEQMLFVLGIISYFITSIEKMQIDISIKKNSNIILQQLDFEKEVESTEQMQKNCKYLSYVKIPKVYKEITKSIPNIIVQEFLEGKTICQLFESDCEMYAPLVLKYGFVSSFIHGFTHGDLHAGNILFIKTMIITKKKLSIPKYQIGIIDFGIVLEIKENVKNTMLNVLVEMNEKPPSYTADKLFRCFINNFDELQEEQKKKMIETSAEIIGMCLHKKNDLNHYKLYEFIWKINNLLNENNQNVKFNDDFIQIQMAFAMTHGLTMRLCNDDYIDFLNQIVNELFHLDLLGDFFIPQ